MRSSSKTPYNVHCTCLFLPLTDSNHYCKCLATLWKWPYRKMKPFLYLSLHPFLNPAQGEVSFWYHPPVSWALQPVAHPLLTVAPLSLFRSLLFSGHMNSPGSSKYGQSSTLSKSTKYTAIANLLHHAKVMHSCTFCTSTHQMKQKDQKTFNSV